MEPVRGGQSGGKPPHSKVPRGSSLPGHGFRRPRTCRSTYPTRIARSGTNRVGPLAPLGAAPQPTSPTLTDLRSLTYLSAKTRECPSQKARFAVFCRTNGGHMEAEDRRRGGEWVVY